MKTNITHWTFRKNPNKQIKTVSYCSRSICHKVILLHRPHGFFYSVKFSTACENEAGCKRFYGWKRLKKNKNCAENTCNVRAISKISRQLQRPRRPWQRAGWSVWLVSCTYCIKTARAFKVCTRSSDVWWWGECTANSGQFYTSPFIFSLSMPIVGK